MNTNMDSGLKAIKVRPYFISLLLAWSCALIILSTLGFFYIRYDNLLKAKTNARLNFSKDLIFLQWVSSHGGLYAPESETTPVNPYLSHITERDIKTPLGKKLTLVNPAYAMRQIAGSYHASAGIKVHIAGLKPLRAETAPDQWEKDAIHQFQKGSKEVYGVTQIENKLFMRLMRPMIIKASCLECHSKQGYTKGQVGGGVSVSIPMHPYFDEIDKQQMLLGGFLFILWGLGISGLGFISNKLREKIEVQQSLERKLIQNEKLASIGVLVSGIAHEINNPNNFISFNMPILKDYLKKIMPIVDAYAKKNPEMVLFHMPYNEFRKDIFKLIDNVQYGSERILSIIENLKGFSRTNHETEIERIELEDIINKTLTFTRNVINKSVKNFEVHLPQSLPTVIIHTSSLEQVLINILTNAAQAFDESDYENAKIDFSVFINNNDKGVIFEIKDNGSGMKKETIDNIFLPFFSTKTPSGGTGLGLYICHILVENMGGEIDVNSIEGEGSIFYVKINNIVGTNN